MSSATVLLDLNGFLWKQDNFFWQEFSSLILKYFQKWGLFLKEKICFQREAPLHPTPTQPTYPTIFFL